jgi:hypothetical protein
VRLTGCDGSTRSEKVSSSPFYTQEVVYSLSAPVVYFYSALDTLSLIILSWWPHFQTSSACQDRQHLKGDHAAETAAGANERDHRFSMLREPIVTRRGRAAANCSVGLGFPDAV